MGREMSRCQKISNNSSTKCWFLAFGLKNFFRGEDAGEGVVWCCWKCFFLLFIWFVILTMNLHLSCFIDLMILLRYQLNLYKKLPFESQCRKNPLWTEIRFHSLWRKNRFDLGLLSGDSNCKNCREFLYSTKTLTSLCQLLIQSRATYWIFVCASLHWLLFNNCNKKSLNTSLFSLY